MKMIFPKRSWKFDTNPPPKTFPQVSDHRVTPLLKAKPWYYPPPRYAPVVPRFSVLARRRDPPYRRKALPVTAFDDQLTAAAHHAATIHERIADASGYPRTAGDPAAGPVADLISRWRALGGRAYRACRHLRVTGPQPVFGFLGVVGRVNCGRCAFSARVLSAYQRQIPLGECDACRVPDTRFRELMFQSGNLTLHANVCRSCAELAYPHMRVDR